MDPVVVIDIPEDLEFKQWSKCWIHRVPRNLRKVKADLYTPQLISIGPFHHNKKELKAMDSHKEKYKEELFKRISDGEQSKQMKKSIEDLIRGGANEIRCRYAGTMELDTTTLEPADDKLYAGTTELDTTPSELAEGKLYAGTTELDTTTSELADDKLVKMIMRDAGFIVELFLRNDCPEESAMDYILSTPWLRKAVKLDLLLLENQLPYRVLEQLYERVSPFLPAVQVPISPNFRRMHPFLRLTCSFFKDHILTESDWEKIADVQEVKHFTNLVRECWLPKKSVIKNKYPQGPIGNRRYLYSATKLDKAGVTFEPAKEGTSQTDVKIFKKPILKFIPAINFMQLKLPELKLESDTECLLRNVMALEQCLYPQEDYICGYVALMDQLINTGEDVDFLVERKIITNLLGSNKEAAGLFNGLCNQIPREKSFYAHYYNELNTFYENRWNVTRATLKKVYFKDLWTGSSTVVGLFVLLFTVTATTRNVYLR